MRGGTGSEGAPRWRSHALAGSLFFFLGTDLFIVSPLLPEISRYFHVSAQESAVVAVAFGGTYMMLGPFAALITDQFTRQRAIVIGGLVFGLGGILAGLSPTLEVLVAARILSAVGATIMGAPVWSYVTETALPGRAGATVALVSGLFASGQIVGVPLSAALASTGRWQLAFMSVGFFALVAAVLVHVFLAPEERKPTRSGIGPSIKASLLMWRRPELAVRIGANLFGQGARVSAYTFAGSIMMGRFDYSTAVLGLIGAGVGIGSLVGSLAGGWLVTRAQQARRAQSPISVWGAVVMAGSLFLAVLAEHGPLAVTGWILAFVAGSCLVSNNQEMIARTAGTQRAFALSWNNSSLYAGTAVGTAVLSTVPLGGMTFAFIAAAFALASAACSFAGWGPERRRLASGGMEG